MGTAIAVQRKRLLRLAGHVTVLLAAALTVGCALSPTVRAAKTGVTEISSDPYPSSSRPIAAHATEVEPDSFAFGSMVVTAFQTGLVFNGGSSDIGFATTRDGGGSWTHGYLPTTDTASKPAGKFFGLADSSVAYDARDRVWLISYLALTEPVGAVRNTRVDVMVSRSKDGLKWSDPVTIAATGTFYDKDWTVCDNHKASRHYGNCYAEFDNAASDDLEQMSASTDGGLTWSSPQTSADSTHGVGGQPVVQPGGRVVVPYEALSGEIRSFSSDDGGVTWHASVLVAPLHSHRVAGLRTLPLPSAETNAAGVVYVAWQDSSFENGLANDIVYSTSSDGDTWSSVSRIPIDPVGSNVDHVTPGLAVNSLTRGTQTQLALTYYRSTDPGCTGRTCRIQAGFISSTDNGATWSTPVTLGAPMQIGWLAPTDQGAMAGDYISTSFLASQHRAIGVFAAATSAPTPSGQFSEPMFAALENVPSATITTGPRKTEQGA
ncbi:MAG: exo-alpha-sialidase [Actinobacteria bacterium]|nr:exo-alpha-sialidase [Actinomycetota bacterium]